MKLITQKTDFDCVYCTLAMFLNVPYDDIVGVLNHRKVQFGPYGLDWHTEHSVIRFFGKRPVKLKLKVSGVPGILTVASLNFPSSLHSVYVDKDNKIFDPQTGVEGKKWYEPNAFPPCFEFTCNADDDDVQTHMGFEINQLKRYLYV